MADDRTSSSTAVIRGRFARAVLRGDKRECQEILEQVAPGHHDWSEPCDSALAVIMAAAIQVMDIAGPAFTKQCELYHNEWAKIPDEK